MTKSTDEINDEAIDEIKREVDEVRSAIGDVCVSAGRDRSLGLDSDRNVVVPGTPSTTLRNRGTH
jgi:hypothetical protein